MQVGTSACGAGSIPVRPPKLRIILRRRFLRCRLDRLRRGGWLGGGRRHCFAVSADYLFAREHARVGRWGDRRGAHVGRQGCWRAGIAVLARSIGPCRLSRCSAPNKRRNLHPHLPHRPPPPPATSLSASSSRHLRLQHGGGLHRPRPVASGGAGVLGRKGSGPGLTPSSPGSTTSTKCRRHRRMSSTSSLLQPPTRTTDCLGRSALRRLAAEATSPPIKPVPTRWHNGWGFVPAVNGILASFWGLAADRQWSADS